MPQFMKAEGFTERRAFTQDFLGHSNDQNWAL